MDRVQVNLRGLPSHVLERVYKPETVQSLRSTESVLSPLTFPKSKVALWDPSPCGDVVTLHLSYYRNPRLLLVEKALRLAHRHARQCNKPFTCFLLGAVAVDWDEEGVTLTLDRFDPGKEQPGSTGKAPTALLPGDIVVPCVFDAQQTPLSDITVHTSDDFNIAFKMLQHCCCSKEALEVSRLLVLRARFSCTEQLDRLSFGLQWAAVTLAGTLDAVPVRAVPVIPTALARTLGSPASTAQAPNTVCRKRGFLTMDQTRKLLLILESDPKAYTLPLVGVWLSGITHVHNPQVWAWCLRYLSSSTLQERVMSEDGAFLVVLYSLTHRDPEFYQCRMCSGQQEMSFQLLTSTESVSLYRNVEPSEGRPLQFELSAENQNQETKLFRETVSSTALTRSAVAGSTASPQNKMSISDHDSGVEDEDLSPRPSPNPHPVSQQTRRVHPSVPELSLVDASFLGGKMSEAHDSAFPYATQANPQRRGSGPTHPLPSGSRGPGQASLAGPPPIRRPLTPVLSQPKPSNGHANMTQHTPRSALSRRSAPSMGNRPNEGPSVSSTSSSPSSSSSSPKAGCSPDGSVHQHRQRPAQPLSGAPHPAQVSSSAHPAAALRSRRRSPGTPSQTPAPPAHSHKLFHSTPASNPVLNTGPRPCSCCANSHGPMYHTSPWHGAPSLPAQGHVSSTHPSALCCTGECAPQTDCCLSPTRHPVGCRSPQNQSPVCGANAPRHCSPSHGPCSPASAQRASADLPVPACQAQCFQAQVGFAAQPVVPVHAPVDAPMGMLPADAYRILVDQDRQLKLLQAQIQKLLEAQSKASSQSLCPQPLPTSPERHNCQQDRAPPMQSPPEPHKMSVSVAVGTGASLFWSDPSQGPLHVEPFLQWHSAPRPCANEDHAVPSSFISGSNHQSHGSQDLEKDGNVEQSPRTSLNQTSGENPVTSFSFQSPVLGESASMIHQPRSAIPEDSSEVRAVDDQAFYQQLLGQVQSRLQDSVTEESVVEQDKRRLPESSTCRDRQDFLPTGTQSREMPSNQPALQPQKVKQKTKAPGPDQVFSATVRQLQQLGVTVPLDSPFPGKAMRETIDCASTLACINPEAVIPRLALTESVGTSTWGPSGSVDLSLEANAIALKYLSDCQLSRLSMGGQSSGSQTNPSALLLGRCATEKSSVGLSILSPSNMSLATCKYMKRYGLIEGGGGSGEEEGEEEEEEEEEVEEEGKRMGSQRVQTDSALGCSLQVENSGNVSTVEERETSIGLVLKNITNKQPHFVQYHDVPQHDSQSRLIRDLRPKMQLLAQRENYPDKENAARQNIPQRRSSMSENQKPQRLSDPCGSVGNILDLSRLKQLPKLF